MKKNKKPIRNIKQNDVDKLCHTVNKLAQGANLKEKWQGIKDSKSKCVPTFTRQKDIRGNRVLPKKKAEAIAEYLSEIQWKKTRTRLKLKRTHVKSYQKILTLMKDESLLM